MAERSLAKRLWYDYLRIVMRLTATGLCHFRVTGREHTVPDGGGLVLSNHQSLFDPVLVGMAFDCRLNYLARDTLFRFAPFRMLINSLDAIPIDREGLGLSGMKETLRRVKQKELVLIFPEGTRTADGEVAPMKAGFAALAKRAKASLIPVGIDGAFQAWPRTRLLPGLTTIHVHVGEAILSEEARSLDEYELVKRVEGRIRQCHEIARQGRLRAMGLLPAPVRSPQVAAGTSRDSHVA